MKNKYSVGTIVTLKSHPLLYNLRIKGDGKLIPPFMIVEKVTLENKSKKTHSEDLGLKISDRIKYTCVFFDDNKTEFKRVVVYESMILDYSNIFIERKDGKPEDNKESYESLIDEVRAYSVPKYEYGKILFFRTKKFEIFKKRDSVKNQKTEEKGVLNEKKITTVQYIVNYSTPDFVLCGIKNNEESNKFYPNGDKKEIVSNKLFKVKWFNSYQMKFSDIYLPAEFFTSVQPFDSVVPYNNKRD